MTALGAGAATGVADAPLGWMPAETALHERTWMAFPPRGTAVTATDRAVHEARRAWTEVAHAVARFEPVTMVVDPADTRDAARMLSGEITQIEAPLDDAWMRDIGPTFVHRDSGTVDAVTWAFNGWGQQAWARWTDDAQIGRTVARAAGCAEIASRLINEGGGIVADGRGTIFLTETVQLDPDRNPEASRATVEAELHRTLGIQQAIWIPRGLTRDTQPFGTRGHADLMVASPSVGRLLVHTQTDRMHPDHAITRELVSQLVASRDVTGRPFEVLEVPAPRTLRDHGGWVDYSYINHTPVNGGVIACAFNDPNDAHAADLLAEAYPGREVVPIDARPMFARGGGIHCITLQQPAAMPPVSIEVRS